MKANSIFGRCSWIQCFWVPSLVWSVHANGFFKRDFKKGTKQNSSPAITSLAYWVCWGTSSLRVLMKANNVNVGPLAFADRQIYEHSGRKQENPLAAWENPSPVAYSGAVHHSLLGTRRFWKTPKKRLSQSHRWKKQQPRSGVRGGIDKLRCRRYLLLSHRCCFFAPPRTLPWIMEVPDSTEGCWVTNEGDDMSSLPTGWLTARTAT